MDITFLLGSSAVAVVLVQGLKYLYGKVSDRYGALVAQLTLLAVSFCVAGIGAGLQLLPPEILETTLVVFASAIAIYEVFVKALWQKAIKDN